jgi:hypothetical protein
MLVEMECYSYLTSKIKKTKEPMPIVSKHTDNKNEGHRGFHNFAKAFNNPVNQNIIG